MNGFADFISATETAASSVYHAVVASETCVQNWEIAHPAIKPLVDDAVSYANTLLSRVPGPLGGIGVVAEDILTALKGLAIRDATLPSLPSHAAGTAPLTSGLSGVIDGIETGVLGGIEANTAKSATI